MCIIIIIIIIISTTKFTPCLQYGWPVCLHPIRTNWKYQTCMIYERALFFRRFPGLAHFSFCREQILGEKPDLVKLSATNNTRTGMVSYPGLRGHRQVTYRLDHGTALKTQSVPRSKHTLSPL